MTLKPLVLSRIHTLCTTFSDPSSSLPSLLSNFTTSEPWAFEHGLPALAPFLGRKFSGIEGLTRYFTLLAETLEIEWMRVEGEEGWVVDVDVDGDSHGIMKVSLRGEARFRWKSTGQAWEEGFAYRIGLVDEGEGAGAGAGAGAEGDGNRVKVKEYEVWADTGAAYLARKGELDRLE
ncbi:hypothetical protein P170DRAFT_507373 [Aspergillus steynii IBT 23096]|uniref:SnoaL-like domain-containing protein n=1 Tax=Aspergillus steynii IBT 23096 TaxID=1392250 RepID=A0A2I2GIE0_9EURO|nr:uncharacterized protein P170DRAFT_507373 [Aspergillus steynii IBT 23096]PLB52617.1 hypothetical protein P170DRAFT_507373 [Aspergillus steynii IBT 23096]